MISKRHSAKCLLANTVQGTRREGPREVRTNNPNAFVPASLYPETETERRKRLGPYLRWRTTCPTTNGKDLETWEELKRRTT